MLVKELKALAPGDNIAFSSVYLFLKGTVRKTKNGGDFLVVELGDKTGSFVANCFGDTAIFHFFKDTPLGSAVRIEGYAEHYNDRFSPKLTAATALNQEDSEAAMQNLVEAAPEGGENLWQELQEHIASIEHIGLRQTVEQVMEDIGDRFKTSPAAISMHHAYHNGLLEHTVHMARAARALFPLYTEVEPSLAMAGIILHDTGKVIEYQSEGGIAKTRKGILQGHVVLGYRLARQAGVKVKLDPNLLERLEHIILSHQGELEWGAAAMAATPEAVFVSMVDNLDAKMGMVQRNLRNTPESNEFSDFIGGLQAPLLITPPDMGETSDSE